MNPALLLAVLTLGASSPGPSDPASLVLVVASNRGATTGRPPLQYADDDGAKYYQVFSTIAGEDDTVLLTELDRDTARLFPELLPVIRAPSRAQVELAVGRLAARARALHEQGRRVRFYFLFAGHGDVDEGRGFLELVDGPLTSDHLGRLITAIGADEAHVILDSCNAYFVVNPRRPGGRRFPTPEAAGRAVSAQLPEVGVFLSTSAQAEVFEWSELQSGIFSHAVRSGLLGAADADADGSVTYEELAAFVEIATVEIRNPMYRPQVFSRGPGGDAHRTIVGTPGERRAVLRLHEPRVVRLAARDADGLRWLDLHAEAGQDVRLWFPERVAARLELERLGERNVILTRHALDGAGGLTGLPASAAVMAERGPGEIFQALFQRPFGAAAMAAYRDDVAARATPRVFVETPPPASEPWPAPAPYLLAAAGAAGGERAVIASYRATLGLRFHPWLALELSGAYREESYRVDSFGYPGEVYMNRSPPGAHRRLQTTPLTLAAKLTLPTPMVRPYLRAGAGLLRSHVTTDPDDFNPVLRSDVWSGVVEAGVGLELTAWHGIFFALDGRTELATGTGTGASPWQVSLMMGVEP